VKPIQSIVAGLVSLLIMAALVGGCSRVSDGEKHAAQAPVSWAGLWEYNAPPAESAGGSPISMQYRLVVDDAKQGGTAQLSIRGFQTDQTILCDVERTNDRIVVKFRSFANGKIVNEYGIAEYREGQPLLTLARSRDQQGQGSVTTEWQRLLEPREGGSRTGVFFQKAAIQ
jgi:hypothetical protein